MILGIKSARLMLGFKPRDRVRITRGKYVGLSGIVIGKTLYNTYTVRLNNGRGTRTFKLDALKKRD